MGKEWISANLLLVIKGKKLTLPSQILRQPRWSSSPNLLNLGPLRIELREAFRRWRVTFRGDLKCFIILILIYPYFLKKSGWRIDIYQLAIVVDRAI